MWYINYNYLLPPPRPAQLRYLDGRRRRCSHLEFQMYYSVLTSQYKCKIDFIYYTPDKVYRVTRFKVNLSHLKGS